MGTMATETISSDELPKMYMGGVLDAYKKLKQLFTEHTDKQVTPEEFVRLQTAVARALPGAIPLSRLAGILTPLVMGVRTAAELDWYARRLAGNAREVVKGQVVSMQPGVACDSWNVGQIVEAETIVTQHGGWRRKLWVRALAGPWSGDEASLITSTKAMCVIGSQLGFSRFTPHLKMHHANELVGFVFTVFIKTPNNPNWGPAVSVYGATAWQFTKNRNLARDRRKGICPHGVVPMNCGDCVRGLDTCKFAVRQYTWVHRRCSKCGDEHWHNPRDMEVCCKCDSARLHRLFEEHQRGK